MSFPRNYERAHDPDTETHRLLLPVTSQQLFNERDHNFLTSLGLSETWVMEYALYIWLGFSHPKFDDVYEIVCDDVISHICVGNDSPNDHRLQVFFAENVDTFMDLLRKVYDAYRVYLQDLPNQVPAEQFESLTLELEDLVHGYTVVNLNVHRTPKQTE